MTITKRRKLVNPGKRRVKRNPRKLSALQKLFFGTKRQRAAVKAKKSNPRRKRTNRVAGYGYKKRVAVLRRKRRKNVGAILTALPAGLNPGRKRRKRNGGYKVGQKKAPTSARGSKRRRNTRKVVIVNMARTRRRRVNRSGVRRRRRNYGTQVGRSWSSYTSRKRSRRGNPGRRRRSTMKRRSIRRNPGMLSGTAGRVVGVLGGLAVTRLLVGFLPSGLTSGFLGYLSIGAVAFLQGKMIGKFTKSPVLGSDMTVGGLAYLGSKVLNDFLPSIGGYTGISGMGLIGPSSFYTPQVPINGSMGQFVLPAAVSQAVSMAAPTASGMGRMRRAGRLS